ncbi:Mannose phosphate isomerase [Carabus blaptoides fortunei]
MNLEVKIQNYDWGKRGINSYVANLAKAINNNLVIEDDVPYAELWMGTHPNGPSTITGSDQKLSEFIKQHPETLGETVIAKFGDQLPYLFKVLSIAKALSIQVHPDKTFAEKLFATRPDLYKDPNHKPELAIALTPFEALCGFRPVDEIKLFLQSVPELLAVVGAQCVTKFLTSDEAGLSKALQDCFKSLMTRDQDIVSAQLALLLNRVASLDESSRAVQQASLIERLNQQFPNDVGCFVVYFLNFVKLAPGEALYLGPNEPHAYLSGDCIECMASSDNVVRAGLTPKFKDVDTLCNMLTYRMESAGAKLFQSIKENDFTELYAPPVEDFAVAKISLTGMTSDIELIPRNSGSIILVTRGSDLIKINLESQGAARPTQAPTNMNAILAVLYLQSFIIITVSAHDFIQKRAIDTDPCIVTVDNTIINLNDFKTPNGYEVHFDGRQFLLNICGTTPGCKGNVSVCEIDPRSKDVKHILGYYETLTTLTSYKPIPGLKYQTSGRKKYHVEIEFKCNRRTKTDIVKYIPPQGQVGRRFKFTFESNSLCIQRKMNCLVNNVLENSMYDLNPLYKKSNNWSVRNVQDGKQIFLNICGPLNKISTVKDRECSYPGTQVCLVDGRVSKNLGIYTSDFYIHHNLSITFSDGSVCDEGNFTQTTIDFFCSFQTQPPVLSSVSSCNYRLSWHTPIACPQYISFGTSCQIYDYFLGHRDFKPLFTNEDKKRRIGNKDVRYNVCDTLFDPCGLYNNASVCVTINDKTTVFGWTNTTIVSKNTALTMDLSGEKCTANVYRLTHINFVCDTAENRPEKLSFSKDMCKLDIDIYTKTACFEHESNVDNCTIQDDAGNLYNLQSLAADTNYEIQDPHDTNLVYVINVCRPIVFGTNSMCDRYSSVCLRNKTEPDITKRYKSLGSLASLKRYTQNGGMFLKYDHGSICKLRNVTQSSTSTEIQFICTRNRQQQMLVFKEKDGCHFKFIWKTHLVCTP